MKLAKTNTEMQNNEIMKMMGRIIFMAILCGIDKTKAIHELNLMENIKV